MNLLLESFQEFWEILTGVIDDNKAKLVRLSCFTVLFLGILWAAVNYFRADRIADTNQAFDSMFLLGRRSSPNVPENRDTMNKFEALAKTISDMREGGEAIATTIAAMNSRPFNVEGVNEFGLEDLGGDRSRDITRLDAIAAMSGNSESQQEATEEPTAPEGIFVKAIMSSGKSAKAVVDAGDLKGLVVRRGDKLPGELGQVVRIKSNGITVRANKRDFDYNVSKIELIKGMR